MLTDFTDATGMNTAPRIFFADRYRLTVELDMAEIAVDSAHGRPSPALIPQIGDILPGLEVSRDRSFDGAPPRGRPGADIPQPVDD
jgi:hypothetical protein